MSVNLATLEARDLERNCQLGTELLSLTRGPPSEGLTRNARREAKVVLDARGCARLTADRALVEYQHRKTFGGGVNRRRQTGGPGADDGHVVYLVGVELRRDAETNASLRVSRPPQDCSVRADHQRKLVHPHAESLYKGVPFATVGSVEYRVRVAVAREESLEPHHVRLTRSPDEHGTGAPCLEEADPSKNQGPHHDFAELSGANQEGTQMGSINRQSGAALWSCPASSD